VLALVGSAAAQVNVSLDKNVRYQTIEGFGASVTDGYNIRPWKVREGPFLIDIDLDSVGFYDTIITNLGATAIRTNIVTSFNPASGQYTISEDMETLWYDLRRLRDAARAHHEPLVFIGTPWSPPAWMKQNGETTCSGLSGTQCRLKNDYEDSLGTYLVKYVQTMTDSGLPYYAVSIQNEPAFSQPFESCVYNGMRYRETLKAVGQAFDDAGLPQLFYGAEHMSHSFPSEFERAIKADPDALKHIDAWAVHGYTDGVQADTGSYSGGTERDKPFWMTETSGPGYGETWADWGKAMGVAKSMLSYLRGGKMSLWTWWTLQGPGDSENAYAYLLHAGGRPTLKWHVSRHFFRFVRPGARQIASSSSDDDVKVVAFWHEGGECLSIVLANMSTSEKTMNAVSLSGGSLPGTFERILSTASEQSVESTVSSSEQVTLPAQSVTTLVSGVYRGSDSVTTVRKPKAPLRVTRSAIQTSAPRRVYGIDGRLVSRRGVSAVRSTASMARGVYIGVDERGRVRRVLPVR